MAKKKTEPVEEIKEVAGQKLPVDDFDRRDKSEASGDADQPLKAEEAPKKKRGRPKKNKEEIKETAEKAAEEVKEAATEAAQEAKEAAAEAKTKAQEKADEFQEKWNSVKDETEEFDKEDIEKNSAYAVLGYFGILVLIPIIFAPNSRFARFHANQAIILFIMSIVYALVAGGIVALLALAGKGLAILFGIIFTLLSLVIFVMWAKGLSNAASGRARKLPIIGEYEIIDVD